MTAAGADVSTSNKVAPANTSGPRSLPSAHAASIFPKRRLSPTPAAAPRQLENAARGRARRHANAEFVVPDVGQAVAFCRPSSGSVTRDRPAERTNRLSYFPAAGIIQGNTYACRITTTPTSTASAMLCQNT